MWRDQGYSESGPRLEEKLCPRHKIHCVAQAQESLWLQSQLSRQGASHKKLWVLREQPSARCQSSLALVHYTPTRSKRDWSGIWKLLPLLHNEGASLWSRSHVLSTLGKPCIQSPSGCPQECRKSTLLVIVHESPGLNISRRRSSVVHLV
jgi:hypothetical protein